MATKYPTKQVRRADRPLHELGRRNGRRYYYVPFTPRGKVYDLKGKR